MSATDELRRMLDERGVEWCNIRNDGSESDYITEWQFDGIEGHSIATEWAVGQHLTVCIAHPMTPEQAIAATLGSCNCSNSERTGTCLPHFWTHDGTLHIEATRMPTRIVVCEGGTCEFVPKRELDTSEAENAKLRELLGGVGHLLFSLDVDYCTACPRDGINHPCPVYTIKGGECLYKSDMRELGVEVDG